MTSSGHYQAMYRTLTAQLAYARAIRDHGLPALLAPYTLRAVVLPAQRRRFVRTEVAV